MNKIFKVKKNKQGDQIVTSELATNKNVSIVKSLLVFCSLLSVNSIEAASYTYDGDAKNLKNISLSDDSLLLNEIDNGGIAFNGSNNNDNSLNNIVTINFDPNEINTPQIVYSAIAESSEANIDISNNVLNAIKGQVNSTDGSHNSNIYGVVAYTDNQADITANNNKINIFKDFGNGHLPYTIGAHIVALGTGGVTAKGNEINIDGFKSTGGSSKLATVEAFTPNTNNSVAINENSFSIVNSEFNDSKFSVVDTNMTGNTTANGNKFTVSDSKFINGLNIDTVRSELDIDDNDSKYPEENGKPLFSNNSMKLNNVDIANFETNQGENHINENWIVTVDADMSSDIKNNTLSVSDSILNNTQIFAVSANGNYGDVVGNKMSLKGTKVENSPYNIITAVKTHGSGDINFINNTLDIGPGNTFDEKSIISAVFIDGYNDKNKINGIFDGNKVVINGASNLKDISIYSVYPESNLTSGLSSSKNFDKLNVIKNSEINISDSTLENVNIAAASVQSYGSVDLSGNKVFIDNSKLSNYSVNSAYSTNALSANLSNNALLITNESNLTDLDLYTVYSNNESSKISGNLLSINGGSVESSSKLNSSQVVAVYSNDNTAEISNNILSIKNTDLENSKINTVLSNIKSGSISNNTLLIESSRIKNIPNNIISTVQQNGNGGVNLLNNILKIGDDVTFEKGTKLAAVYVDGENTGLTQGNMVIVDGQKGTTDLSNVNIYGVYKSSQEPALSRMIKLTKDTNQVIATKNSTLEIHSYGKTIDVNSVNNFNNYNFYLDGDKNVENGNAILNTKEKAALSVDDSINVTVNGNVRFNKGDSFKLFKNVDDENPNREISMKVGSGAVQNVSIKNGELTTTSDLIQNSSGKALIEPQSVTISFLNQGSDLINSKNINSRLSDGEWTGFTGVNFSSSRYNTGSHVKVNGYGLLVGAAKQKGDLAIGAFFETGSANYSTHNNSANDEIYGKGDTNYRGFGLLGRYDISSTLYLKANVRIGRAKINYKNDDLKVNNINAHYESRSMYYGSSIGLGNTFSINDSATFDLQSRYTFTKLSGNDIVTDIDHYDFDSTKSNRLELDGNYNFVVNDWATTYLGMGYQYELSGKSKAKISGVQADSTSLKGGTEIIKLGLIGDIKQFSYNLDLNGYIGKREGVSGNLNIQYHF